MSMRLEQGQIDVLVVRMSCGDSVARELLIKHYMGLVITIAKNASWRCLDRRDDFISVALYELVRCVDRFAVVGGDGGVKTWIVSCVKHRLLSELREGRTVVRAPKGVGDVVVVGGGIEDDMVMGGAGWPGLSLMIREEFDKVTTCLDRRVVMMYMAGWNDREIAEKVGMSKTKVNSLRLAAIGRFRDSWVEGKEHSDGRCTYSCERDARECYRIGGCRKKLPRAE